MITKVELLIQKAGLLGKQVVELSAHVRETTQAWSALRSRHERQIKRVGWLFFRDWAHQHQEVAELAAFAKEKCTRLKSQHDHEVRIMDDFIGSLSS